MRSRGALAAVAAASGLLVPVAALAPGWLASAPSSQAFCIHITINFGGQPSSTCPPSEPGPALPPLNLPNIITPDGQLNIPPYIVPNEPKPPLIPDFIPPIPPLH